MKSRFALTILLAGFALSTAFGPNTLERFVVRTDEVAAEDAPPSLA